MVGGGGWCNITWHLCDRSHPPPPPSPSWCLCKHNFCSFFLLGFLSFFIFLIFFYDFSFHFLFFFSCVAGEQNKPQNVRRRTSDCEPERMGGVSCRAPSRPSPSSLYCPLPAHAPLPLSMAFLALFSVCSSSSFRTSAPHPSQPRAGSGEGRARSDERAPSTCQCPSHNRKCERFPNNCLIKMRKKNNKNGQKSIMILHKLGQDQITQMCEASTREND